VTLAWNQCQGDVWCSLSDVDLSHNHFDGMEGVYAILHGGTNPATVRVGQGIIRDRLQSHRIDPDIQAYAHLQPYVTWARVSARDRDGVEAYLAQKLQPLVGKRFPKRKPISVNTPW
jgi:hypothetical protein